MTSRGTASTPDRAGLVLVAAVANLDLAVANVALPSIGKGLRRGRSLPHLSAVGYRLAAPRIH